MHEKWRLAPAISEQAVFYFIGNRLLRSNNKEYGFPMK